MSARQPARQPAQAPTGTKDDYPKDSEEYKYMEAGEAWKERQRKKAITYCSNADNHCKDPVQNVDITGTKCTSSLKDGTACNNPRGI